MLDIRQFRDNIVKPIIVYLGFDKTESDVADATYMLLATAIHESRLSWLRQVRGPALGVYQIEPATIDSLLLRMAKNPELKKKVDSLLISGLGIHENMVGNLYFATAMARYYYRTKPGKLPHLSKSNPENWLRLAAQYWKTHYNTMLGKGTEDEFIRSNAKLVSVISQDETITW